MQQALEKTEVIKHEYVSFLIGEQSFCLEISKICEIRRWGPATPLPHAPAYVLGVINLRGSVIPIFDLSARLGFGAADPTERSVIMIVAEADHTIGLVVDSVSEILTMSPENMQPRPEIGSDDDCEQITGFFVENEKIIRAIDLSMIIEPAALRGVET
jgi:purine-binding chemotaxis protein CheW